jgi:WD40 repeat protein
VRIWDIASGVRIRTLGHEGHPLRALAVTHRQQLLVTGGEEGMGYAWNARSGDQLPPYHAGATIEMITAVPDGDRVLVATPTSVVLWDPMAGWAAGLDVPAVAGRAVAVLAANGSPLVVVCEAGWTGLFDPVSGEPRDHVACQGPVACAALSECGRYLAVGGHDGTVTVRDLNDLQLPPQEQIPPGARMSAMGAGTGTRRVALIVGGDREGSVTAWNVANGRRAWHRPAPRVGYANRREVTAVAVAGSAGYTLTGGRDGLANVWDLPTGKRRHHLACGAPITALTSSRDGQYAVAGTSRGEMVVGRVWIADGLQPRHGHDAPVSAALATAGGFVTAAQRTVRLWNPADGQVVRKWPHPAEVLCLARAGGDVITGSADGVARLLSPGDPQPTRVFSAEGVPVTAVAAGGPDTVVVGSDDGTIRAWRHGRVLTVIKTRARVERALVVAAGTKAVSSHRDRSAFLWDLAEGTPVAKFDDFLMTVAALDVNADETLVAIGGQDGTVLIVDIRHGGVETRIQRQPGTLLTSLAFVAGGGCLAVGYESGSSRVWNLVTSDWLPERLVHPGPVAAITPLGARHFLSASEDGSVGLWRLADQEHVELCAHLLVAVQVTCLAASAFAEPILVGTVSGDLICLTCR